MRLAGFLADPRLVRDPVDFPGLAAIVRKRLFKVRHIRVGVRPDKSNLDQFAVEGVLAVKLAASIFELADLGRDDGAILAVGPIETPLVSLWIVGAQGQTFDVTACALGLEFFELGTAIPNPAGDGSAVDFDPGVGARQGMQAALQMNFPAA